MSKREDIVDGSEAINRQYGLVYTCNLGWLDLGHMNPREVHANAGAAALWRQIQSGGRTLRRHGADGRMAGSPADRDLAMCSAA
jgi:hypothetical protein